MKPGQLLFCILITFCSVWLLIWIWNTCQQKSPKTQLEMSADSLTHYSNKARIAHDSVNYYDQKYAAARISHDSLAQLIFRGSPALAFKRDSLRAVIEARIRAADSGRASGQPDPVRKSETHAPRSNQSQ
ncbi:hypothetical protein [Arundinibacter roseus]|uniref:Uncharacterized protein n=1 Tax=Arundinibacter roseus TaxID=2070510 RepID=A0A4R4KJ23_9BACT|nr:hypothetical protein [Arundinibacter roseus]TDB66806.1 hypothetical protein EZE20_06685 [Arundinibacter roseus]